MVCELVLHPNTSPSCHTCIVCIRCWHYNTHARTLSYTVQCDYISSEQASLSGLSSHLSSSLIRGIAEEGTPGYGVTPPVNISQQVTPNDHYTVTYTYVGDIIGRKISSGIGI